jgi:AcrR family transcriptional regulator
MRKTRDGNFTKDTVLAAAKTLFAEHGYSGTSLAMISDHCGISDGLILHHFKSKKNLYHLVLEELASGYAQTIQAGVQGGQRFEDVAGQAIESTFRFWSEDTIYNRISLWAYLEDQPELVEAEARLTVGLAGMIRQLQAQGKIDPRYSPFVLLSMAIGPIHFWVRYREQFKAALNLSASMDEMNGQFIEQFTDLIRKLYQNGNYPNQ